MSRPRASTPISPWASFRVPARKGFPTTNSRLSDKDGRIDHQGTAAGHSLVILAGELSSLEWLTLGILIIKLACAMGI